MTELHLTGTFLEADKPNANGRVYPRAVLEDIARQIKEKDGRVFGQVGFPEGTSVDLSKVSHIVGDVHVNEQGELIGKIIPLKTPAGEILTSLLEDFKKNKVNYGFRPAGIGKVDENGVVSDYRLISIDLVQNPA